MGDSDVYYMAGIMAFWICLAGTLTLFLADDSLAQSSSNTTQYQDSLNISVDGSINVTGLEAYDTPDNISFSPWGYLKVFASMFAFRLPLVAASVNWFISGFNWVMVGTFIFLFARFLRGVG